MYIRFEVVDIEKPKFYANMPKGKYCDMLGFRQSGKQIYSYLKNADYTDISLEKSV